VITNVHINSLKAYHTEHDKLSKRARAIHEFLQLHAGPYTDRQIMGFMGFTEPNAVRPRITEMVKVGLLHEVGDVKCSVTNKTVRLVQAASLPETTKVQMEML